MIEKGKGKTMKKKWREDEFFWPDEREDDGYPNVCKWMFLIV